MNYLHNDFNNEMTSSFKQLFPNEWKNTFNPINNDASIHVNIHNERDSLKLKMLGKFKRMESKLLEDKMHNLERKITELENASVVNVVLVDFNDF